MNKKIIAILAALLVCAGTYFFIQGDVSDSSNMKKEFTDIRDKGNPLSNEQKEKEAEKPKVPDSSQSSKTSDEFKQIRDKGNPMANKK